MHALLLPVKDLSRAKQRLANQLSQEERTALAQAMFEDFCAAVVTARRPESIVLVSSWQPAIEVARTHGWDVVLETEQESESASVDFASRICGECGIKALARVPADLPLIRGEDIDAIFEAGEGGAEGVPGMVIVPSRDGTGTNALLRTPPTLFPSQFGENSFPKHVGAAERIGARVRILRNERLELDVDDWSDLRALALHEALAEARNTARWLAGSGLLEELRLGDAERVRAKFVASA
jgi:2-phospho-L-lactate/phosphoenolpyruvate guanylyltransferase